MKILICVFGVVGVVIFLYPIGYFIWYSNQVEQDIKTVAAICEGSPSFDNDLIKSDKPIRFRGGSHAGVLAYFLGTIDQTVQWTNLSGETTEYSLVADPDCTPPLYRVGSLCIRERGVSPSPVLFERKRGVNELSRHGRHHYQIDTFSVGGELLVRRERHTLSAPLLEGFSAGRTQFDCGPTFFYWQWVEDVVAEIRTEM